MNFLKKIKEHIILNMKILTLWDVSKYFTFRHYLKIVITFFLNVTSSVAKILAPAAMAKAVEMIALSEEEWVAGPLVFSATDLLFLCVALMTWVKSEGYLKKLIIREFEQLQIDNNVMKVIRTSHQLPFEQHLEAKTHITKNILEIINSQSKLVTEVMTNVSQSLLDIIVGNFLIFRRYGKFLGGEFLLYCILDIFFLSFFVDFIANQNSMFNKLDKALHKFINHEYEILNCEETVRMFHHENLETRLSKKLLDNYLQRNSSFQLSEDVACALKIIPIIIANVIPISYMLKEKVTLQDLDDFIFLLSYINLFGGSITTLNQSLKICMRAVQSLTRQNEFHERNISDIPALQLSISPLEMLTTEYSSPLIEFKDVVFAYPNYRAPALNKITFTIKPGTSVGIIGRSNAGKSTIIKLLFGLYKHQSGSIKLNGHDINGISPSVLARIFCCVPQNAELFRDRSLKYNVLYGANDEDIIYNTVDKKAKKDQAVHPNYHTINMELNDIAPQTPEELEANQQFSEAMVKVNLASLVNPSAENKNSTVALSGGQRQRVSIARALVRHSSVFIFDESSSALDSFTESEVLTNIKRITHDKTTLMIAHRLATVRDVNEILVIENGQVVEQGNPRELLDRHGVYYQYWQAQNGR